MSIKDNLADKNETENFIEEDNKFQKSTSQTFLKEIVKKVELHLSLHIPKPSLTQSYVYFLLRKLESLPTVTTYEEASELMPEYFEFGFINQHPLVALNQVLSNIYLPLFQDEHLITKILPENCKLQSKQALSLLSEFNQETTEFIHSTNEAILQIEKPFVFRLPDIPSSCVPEELAQEVQFVAETQEFVSEWITVITDLLEEFSQKENPGSDLLSEIEFWKRQKFKLSTYFDQLSHSGIQKSINILQLAN
ncbi:Dynein heavy chain 10, axonemal, partial [Stegodyphus mimosarum]